jgi:hypothetical protein
MSNDLEIAEKFGFVQAQQANDIVQIEQSKAMHEVQARLIMARKLPRDQMKSFSNIINACKRPGLAEDAMYAYPKGGELVTGPSIRLAEVLAQNWGNIDFGIREISQVKGSSFVEAYAWDLETNVIQTKQFHIQHKRFTRQGVKDLTDSRDIYELVANNGARRLRACILGVIPGDITDAAVEQCKKTLSSGQEPLSERIKKLVTAFDEFGVKVEHLEKRLGHKLDATIETEFVTLRAVYKSIKDGMASRESYFDFGGIPSDKVNAVNEILESKKNKTKVKDDQSTQTEIDQEFLNELGPVE